MKVNDDRKEQLGLYMCSLLMIGVTALFLFFLRFDVPLYGDDVGWLVRNNPDSSYLDEQVVTGECTVDLDYSFQGVISRLCHGYLQWDGRVISRLVVAVIRWIFSRPDVSNWMLFSGYIMLVHVLLLLFTVRSICGSVKKGMQAPAVCLLTAVLLYLVPSYSYAYMTRLVMYVFTNIYVLSVILYLAFYGLLRNVYERFANERHAGAGTADERFTAVRSADETVAQTKSGGPGIATMIGANLLGLCAGLSHEAYGVIFGMVLLTQLVRFFWKTGFLKTGRKASFRVLFRFLFLYAGYLVGFCICFFAPGNFNRAGQSHEAALHTVPLFTRLWNSVYIHAFVAYKVWIVPVVVLPVLLILTALLLRKKMLTWKEMLSAVLDNLEWFLGFVMSAVTWGIVPRVMNYGMLAANVVLVIGVLRVLLTLWNLVAGRLFVKEKQLECMRKILAGLSIAAVCFLAAGRYPQMVNAHQTGSVWRERIYVARKVGAKEMTLPAYAEDLDRRFYDVDAINSQIRYDQVSYCVVYGTHVVIDPGL